MCRSPQRKLFLRGQTLSLLTGAKDPEVRRACVCGGGAERFPKDADEEAKWIAQDRKALWEQAAGRSPLRRVALVCEAGLGKTTNMEWLQAHIAGLRGGRQLPLLLRLDTQHDLEELLVKEHSQPGTLLKYLAAEVQRRAGGRFERHLLALTRYKESGRLSLLIDGLDHAVSRPNVPQILSKLLTSRWQSCPVWISGRPFAFYLAWDLFAGDEWNFLKVEPLKTPEIRFYLAETVEPDDDDRTGVDWHQAVPDEGRDLLGIPRFLHLISGIFSREVAAAKAKKRDLERALDGLDLRTQADVYHVAYFEPGEYVPPHIRIAGQDDRLNARGLIAQGLGVHLEFPNGQFKYLGLNEGVLPHRNNHEERIRYVGALLGAIAFEMYANPNRYRSESREGDGTEQALGPNTVGVDQGKMKGFRKAVQTRLEEAGEVKGLSIDNEFSLLELMNNATVDFLFFRQLEDTGLVWHDRTVQAFFAAHWAMKYATDNDREQMKEWIVDAKGDQLGGFNEFWTFAAELPDALVDNERWLKVFGACYAPPQRLRGPHEFVQWNRRMIYHSFRRMERRSQATIDHWRKSYVNLATGSAKQRRIHREIEEGFQVIPEEICHYGADSSRGQAGDRIPVKEFRLHQWQVTNEMFEEFDSRHREERWYEGKRHPLVGPRRFWLWRNLFKWLRCQDDRCPVVNVTWYDAWCFAAWCGCRLPTELEWEHACRAGTATAWHCGDIEEQLDQYAWYSVSSGRCTHPVGTKLANENGLYDMHGNVWEWYEDRYEAGASVRVLRGGSWSRDGGGSCRSAYRFWVEPQFRFDGYGFRLAAVPVGAKQVRQG